MAELLEVDDYAQLETDSAYSESAGSAEYLSSLSSSVKNYRYEYGRRYHAFREGSYLVPNDEEEQDRMDFLHHIYRILLHGKLFLAPIRPDVQRVLDIGTGTGIWAIEFADDFPSAQVIGTDLSPIQPQWVPPNCQFEVDDFESPWLYSQPFDFIHARDLEGSVADEELLFRRVFENLKPGGYFEIDGPAIQIKSDDGSHEKAETTLLYMRDGHACARRFGKPADQAPFRKDKLKKIGFVDVTEIVLKLPYGPWPKDPVLKEAGRYQQVQMTQAYESYTPGYFNRVGGWSEEETTVLLAKLNAELKDPSIHMYTPLNFVYGRKPPIST